MKYLDNNEHVYKRFQEFFSPDSILEVFVKEMNGDQIRDKDSIEYHLGCSLASCLFKKDPKEREYISIGEMKKLGSEEFEDAAYLIGVIREKFGFGKEKPLTILWRVDEVQNIDPKLDVQKILKEKDMEKQKRERHATRLYQYVSQLMGLFVQHIGTSTFILPILSGTSDENLIRMMPGSTFVIESIPLYISDLTVDNALNLMKGELEEKVIWRIQNIKLLLYSLGPIPRLIQYMVQYLKKNPNSSLKEIYTYMQDQVKSLYKLHFDQTTACILLLEMIDQWKLNQMSPYFEQLARGMMVSGHLFQTREETLMMPLIFVELLFDKFSDEWKPLRAYISRGVKGEIYPVDLELFPCYFYAFKVHLYQTLKIYSMNMRHFFKGAYMKEVH
jgi:hypothetical protein